MPQASSEASLCLWRLSSNKPFFNLTEVNWRAILQILAKLHMDLSAWPINIEQSACWAGPPAEGCIDFGLRSLESEGTHGPMHWLGEWMSGVIKPSEALLLQAWGATQAIRKASQSRLTWISWSWWRCKLRTDEFLRSVEFNGTFVWRYLWCRYVVRLVFSKKGKLSY